MFDAAVAVARAEGWEITDLSEQALSFRAIATSALWRFQDEVRVAVSEGEHGAQVRVQSASQFGKADFGANARRIVVFHELLERRL